jgi:hypothetical protein
VGITVHGNQTAGQINNVEGTMYTGAQYGQVAVAEVHRAVRELAEALPRVPLPEREQVEAQASVRGIDEELRRPEPDKDRVAEHVGRLTRILRSAGALAGAATGLAVPLGTLASWLGRTIASFV